MSRLFLLCLFLLAGCSGGAVVFAPTQPPPDLSPLRYSHPGGAFTVVLPRNWSVYEQHTTVLASAAFAEPGTDEPMLRLGVINLGRPVDSSFLAELLDRYQTVIRSDAGRYTEVDRQAMGDGSWRLSGLRQTLGGFTEQVNTFIQRAGNFIGVAEVIIPNDPLRLVNLQQIVNSFTINTDSVLQATEPETLAQLGAGGLEVIHLSTWTTPAGVFFITGEVANLGNTLVTDVPLRAVLRTPEGLPVAEAVDVAMGYGIPPGGFAPFSLRFGQGQPALTATFELELGGVDWTPEIERTIYGAERLTWTDASQVEGDGSLVVTGGATNIGAEVARDLRAVVTVFDTTGNVIAAGFNDFAPVLNPNESAPFRLAIPEMGGQPANYILTVQGLP
ncbi:MAG: hypothetical protein K8L97_13840 [Anaerolineae bacterium]|nr:hypothetical protein [Anaerolineae bacterium]